MDRSVGQAIEGPAGNTLSSEAQQVPSAGVAPDLQIRLLGAFSVRVGSRTIPDAEWYLRKSRAVIKLLALNDKRQMHCGQLMDLLWPEFDAQAAANNLHKALHVARRVLEPDLPPKAVSSFLHLHGGIVSLDPPGYLVTDVDAFESAGDVARSTRDPARYREALALYTGELLPEDRYEDWAAGKREQLRSLFSALQFELAGIYERQGDLPAAVEVLRELVEQDSIHEDAQAQLMRLLALSGQRHLAIRQYRLLADALQRELDAEPDPNVQILHQQILNGDVGTRQVEPVAPTLPIPPFHTELSAPSLMGRELELQQIQERLDRLFVGQGGLVVIRGASGIGKSRLAAEAADRAGKLGAITLWGAALRQETPVPYGLFLSALDGLALRLPESAFRMLLGHNAAVLASVSRAVALSRGPDEPVEQKGDIGAALSDVFRRLTRHGPSLMVLEDLEAADEHSLDLLYQLATGQREVPLLLVCTCRTEEVVPDGPVARLFQRLDGPKLASYVEPRALSFVETQLLVAQLLGGQLDQAGLNAIYLLAKGNPYYTEEAVRALRGRGQLSESNGIWYVPGGVSVGWNRDQLRRRPSGSGDFRLAAHFRIRS